MNQPSQPAPDAIRKQLSRVADSRVFADSERLVEFLRYLVETVLAGKGDTLREATIGTALYKREPPYDPRIDSTVRVEARRLRQKLSDYYEEEGQADRLRISLPTGGYLPTFSSASDAARVPDQSPERLFPEGNGAIVAVLPLRSLGRAPEDEDFADGLTEELIFALGRVRGIRVISRSIAFQFKDRPYALDAVARDLAADAILQGTIRRDQNTVRVSIELSDPRGYVLWTDRFDETTGDLIGLQEQIAATLTSRVQIDNSDMLAMKVSPGTKGLYAHAMVYRARRMLDRQTPKTVASALQMFEETAREHPNYARAFAGIADAHCDLYRLGEVEMARASALARQAAQRSFEIDQASNEAHLALARIALWIDRDVGKTVATLDHALSLVESARGYRLYGIALTIAGRPDEAERKFAEARLIEPISRPQDIAEAVSFFQSRSFSLVTEKPAPDAVDVNAEISHMKALSLIFSEKADLAGALVPVYRSAATDYKDLAFAALEIEARLGRKGDIDRLIASSGIKATQFALATLAVAAGERDRALTALENAVSRSEFSTIWLPTDIRFDALRGGKRFKAIVDTSIRVG